MKKWKSIIVSMIGLSLMALPIFSVCELKNNNYGISIDGKKFQNMQAAYKYLQVKYGVKNINNIQDNYFLEENGKKVYLGQGQVNQLVDEAIKNSEIKTIYSTSADIEKNLLNPSMGELSPKWFNDTQIEPGSLVNIYKGNNNSAYLSAEDALDSYIDSGAEVFYFNNIFFSNKLDLRNYLINHYFVDQSNKNVSSLRIKAPNGEYSNVISLNSKSDWKSQASAFIEENCQRIIKVKTNNGYKYVSANNKDLLQESITFEDIPYIKVKANEGKMNYIIGLNQGDKYALSGSDFYTGYIDIGTGMNSATKWTRLLNHYAPAYTNEQEGNFNVIINGFFDLFIDKGSQTTDQNGRVNYSSTYLFQAKGDTNGKNRAKLLNLKTFTVPSLVNNKYLAYNFEKEEVETKEIVEYDKNPSTTLEVSSLGTLSKNYNDYFYTNFRSYYYIYENALKVANNYASMKNFNHLLKIPMLFAYMMDKLISAGAPTELIDLTRLYFRKVTEIYEYIILFTLGADSLKPLNQYKAFGILDLDKLFGIDSKVIEFDINKYFVHLNSVYSSLIVSMSEYIKTSRNIKSSIGIHENTINQSITNSIKLYYRDIPDYVPVGEILNNVKKSFYHTVNVSYDILSNQEVLDLASVSNEAYAAFSMIVNFQKDTKARDNILDNIELHAQELLNSLDTWEYVPNDNMFKKYAFYIKEKYNEVWTPWDILSTIDPLKPDSLIAWNNAISSFYEEIQSEENANIANYMIDYAPDLTVDEEDDSLSDARANYLNNVYQRMNDYNFGDLKGINFNSVNDGIYQTFDEFLAITIMRMFGDLAQKDTLFVMDKEDDFIIVSNEYKSKATDLIVEIKKTNAKLILQLSHLYRGFQAIQQKIASLVNIYPFQKEGNFKLDDECTDMVIRNISQYCSIINNNIDYLRDKLSSIGVPLKEGQIIAFSGTSVTDYDIDSNSIVYDLELDIQKTPFEQKSAITSYSTSYLPKVDKTKEAYVIPEINVVNNEIVDINIDIYHYVIPVKLILEDQVNILDYSLDKYIDVDKCDELNIKPYEFKDVYLYFNPYVKFDDNINSFTFKETNQYIKKWGYINVPDISDYENISGTFNENNINPKKIGKFSTPDLSYPLIENVDISKEIDSKKQTKITKTFNSSHANDQVSKYSEMTETDLEDEEQEMTENDENEDSNDSEISSNSDDEILSYKDYVNEDKVLESGDKFYDEHDGFLVEYNNFKELNNFKFTTNDGRIITNDDISRFGAWFDWLDSKLTFWYRTNDGLFEWLPTDQTYNLLIPMYDKDWGYATFISELNSYVDPITGKQHISNSLLFPKTQNEKGLQFVQLAYKYLTEKHTLCDDSFHNGSVLYSIEHDIKRDFGPDFIGVKTYEDRSWYWYKFMENSEIYDSNDWMMEMYYGIRKDLKERFDISSEFKISVIQNDSKMDIMEAVKNDTIEYRDFRPDTEDYYNKESFRDLCNTRRNELSDSIDELEIERKVYDYEASKNYKFEGVNSSTIKNKEVHSIIKSNSISGSKKKGVTFSFVDEDNPNFDRVVTDKDLECLSKTKDDDVSKKWEKHKETSKKKPKTILTDFADSNIVLFREHFVSFSSIFLSEDSYNHKASVSLVEKYGDWIKQCYGDDFYEVFNDCFYKSGKSWKIFKNRKEITSLFYDEALKYASKHGISKNFEDTDAELAKKFNKLMTSSIEEAVEKRIGDSNIEEKISNIDKEIESSNGNVMLEELDSKIDETMIELDNSDSDSHISNPISSVEKDIRDSYVASVENILNDNSGHVTSFGAKTTTNDNLGDDSESGSSSGDGDSEPNTDDDDNDNTSGSVDGNDDSLSSDNASANNSLKKSNGYAIGEQITQNISTLNVGKVVEPDSIAFGNINRASINEVVNTSIISLSPETLHNINSQDLSEASDNTLNESRENLNKFVLDKVEEGEYNTRNNLSSVIDSNPNQNFNHVENLNRYSSSLSRITNSTGSIENLGGTGNIPPIDVPNSPDNPDELNNKIKKGKFSKVWKTFEKFSFILSYIDTAGIIAIAAQMVIQIINAEIPRPCAYEFKADNYEWQWSGGLIKNPFNILPTTDGSQPIDVRTASEMILNTPIRINNSYVRDSYYYNGKLYDTSEESKKEILNQYITDLLFDESSINTLYGFSNLPDEVINSNNEIDEKLGLFKSRELLSRYVINDIENNKESKYVTNNYKTYNDGFGGEWSSINSDTAIEEATNNIIFKIRPTLVSAKPIVDNESLLDKKRIMTIMPGDSYDAQSNTVITEEQKRLTNVDFNTHEWYMINNSANAMENNEFEISNYSIAINKARKDSYEKMYQLYENNLRSLQIYQNRNINYHYDTFSNLVKSTSVMRPIDVLLYKSKNGAKYFVDVNDLGRSGNSMYDNLLNYLMLEYNIKHEFVSQTTYSYFEYKGMVFSSVYDLANYLDKSS